MSIFVGLMSVVAASAWTQASTDSIEAEGVRFGTGASIGAITEKMRITQGGLVAIGTQSPTATLQVSGTFTVSTSTQTTTPSLYVGLNGNVGIGTASPPTELHLYRSSDAEIVVESDNNQKSMLSLIESSGTGGSGQFATASAAGFRFQYDGAANQLRIIGGDSATSATHLVVNRGGGNVGIGTTGPVAKLDVNGTISATDAVQIGTSSLTCGAGIPGAIRYNATNLQYCNGTSWTTLGAAGVATAASSTGAIQFNSGNSLAGDTANLFWEDANKRLGIGTASPYTPLDISADNGATQTLRSRGTTMSAGVRLGGIQFDSDDSNTNATAYGASIEAFAAGPWADGGAGSSADLVFSTTPAFTSVYAPIERVRISSGGSVGIGAQSPTATLQVSGSFIVSTSAQTTNPIFYVGTNGRVGLGTTTPTVALHVVGDIAYTGVMSDVSDRRMKRDIEPLADASADRLMLLKPVTFRMKDGDDREYGFIAQDVQKVFPELVRDGDILSLNYVGLIAPVVKTVQRLKLENKEQGDRIDALAEQNRLLRIQMKELMLETRKTQREVERLTGAVH